MTMISATALVKQIKTVEGVIDILKGVDLSIRAGEAVAIKGASGSGKTTLLSILAGLDVPTAGDIVLDNINISQLSEDSRAKLRLGRVGFIFQNFELLPHLTALENVMLPLELTGSSNARQQALQLLVTVGLEKRTLHLPRQLSGGEQQRVAIARGYVIQPKILFADEPTGSLDLKNGEKIIDLIFDLQKQFQTTLIFVTHDDLLAQHCERALLLEAGVLT